MINALIVMNVWDEGFEIIDILFPRIDARMKELEEKLTDIQNNKKKDDTAEASNRCDVNHEYPEFSSEVSQVQPTTGEKAILGELYELDGYREVISEELGKYGELGNDIYKNHAIPNKKLKPEECEIMCFNADVEYTETRGYFGDIDVDCSADITLLNVKEVIEKYNLNICEEYSEILKNTIEVM